MMKLLPWVRLALFCFALFGVSAAIVLLKQGRLLQKQHATEPPSGEGAAGDGTGEAGEGGESLAALPGGVEPAAGRSDGSGRADLSAEPGDAPPMAAEKRERTLTAGRSLFEVPEPISIAEATELMNDLRRQKQEFDARRASLDQRQRELDVMEKELETRRTELLELAERVNAATPAPTDADDAAEVDPITVAKLAKILDGMQPDAAARALATYAPERAARVLLSMKEQKAALVLGQLKEDVLSKITDALLKARSAAAGE
jgi:flagellar motility protein MotE (MotC chaperone)